MSQRNHGTKESLRALLAASPGLTPSGAAKALGVDPTTANYHLRRLAREGKAVLGGRPGRARYFAPGSVPRGEREAFALACDATDLLDALRGAPGCTQSQLARRMGVPRGTLAWRLGRLRSAGLVRAERSGREVRLHAEAKPLPGPARGEESL